MHCDGLRQEQHEDWRPGPRCSWWRWRRQQIAILPALPLSDVCWCGIQQLVGGHRCRRAGSTRRRRSTVTIQLILQVADAQGASFRRSEGQSSRVSGKVLRGDTGHKACGDALGQHETWRQAKDDRRNSTKRVNRGCVSRLLALLPDWSLGD